MKNIKTAKFSPEKPEFVKEKKDFINRILVGKNINWIIEMGAAKRLFKKYPDIEFWSQLILPFEVDSITALCSKWGEEFLRKNFNIWTFIIESKSTKIEINLNEVVENNCPKILNKKPTTISDFLKKV